MKNISMKIGAIVVAIAMLCSLSVISFAAAAGLVAEHFGVGQTNADCVAEADFVDGRDCVRNTQDPTKGEDHAAYGAYTSLYYRFDTTSEVAQNPNVTVEIDYYDTANEADYSSQGVEPDGTKESFFFWYVKNDGNMSEMGARPVQMSDNAGWKTARFALTDAGFAATSTALAGNSVIRLLPNFNDSIIVSEVRIWATEDYPTNNGGPVISGTTDGSSIQITDSNVSWNANRSLCTVTLNYAISGEVAEGSQLTVVGVVFDGEGDVAGDVEVVEGSIRVINQVDAAATGAVTFSLAGAADENAALTVNEDSILVVKLGTDAVDTEAQAFFVDLAGDNDYTPEATVAFAAGEGTGSMDSEIILKGEEFELPANAFTAPEGYEFKAWEIEGVEYAEGDVITITKDITITAVWSAVEAPDPGPDPDEPGPVDPPVGNIVYGDVDGSGGFDVFDVLAMIDCYLELATFPDDAAVAAADVDGSGGFDVFDVLTAIDRYLELIDSFPAEA